MSEMTDTYTELCQPYTILGWIEAWNLVHRDADLEDLQILLHRTADLARADKQLNASSTFGITVKNLTTSFSLICMNSFKDQLRIQELLIKYTGREHIEGTLLHQKTKLLRFLLEESADIQDKLLTEKHITQADAEVFNMYGLARNDQAHALNVLNYLRTMIYIKYLSLSNWHGDRHRLQELRYIKKLIRSNGDILAKGTTDAKNMVYHFFDFASSFSYVGKTFRNNGRIWDRWGEHLRDIMIPPKTDAELPCYRLIRRQGNVKNLICFGLFSVANCTAMGIRAWEQQMISTFRPKYNMPYLRQHLQDITYIPAKRSVEIYSQHDKDINSKFKTVGRHRLHDAFSTTTIDLQTRKTIYGTGMDMQALIHRLGDGRFRFQRLTKQIEKMTPREQEKIKTLCMQRLTGRARTIALYRLQHLACRINLELKITQTGIYQQTLRRRVLTYLKKVMTGPVMITLKSVSTPQIMEVMNNHSKWNK